MTMHPIDVRGILYSSPRPGVVAVRLGCRTIDFLEWTDQLEIQRPGMRDEIITEAHYLLMWRHSFAEIAFILGTLWFRSLTIGFLCLVIAIPLEDFRFSVFGPSRVLSQISKIWTFLKWPFLLGAAIFFWQDSVLIAASFIVFLVLQGAFNIITAAVSIVWIPITTRIALSLSKGKEPYLFSPPEMVVLWITNKWRKQLGLSPIA